MSERTDTNIWTKIGNLDRRIIWWPVTIIVAIILINPIGLPIKITKPTTEFYDVIKSMPEGSVVLMEISATTAAWDEVGPGALAIAKELLKQNVKLLTVGVQTPDAPVLADLMFKEAGWTESKTYGEDYVNLGYIAGQDVAVVNMADDFQSLAKDTRGNLLSSLELTKNIVDANDIDLIIDIHTAGSVPEMYVRFWVVPYGVKLVVAVASATIHSVVPWYESGDVLGYLGGIRAIAEYEKISGNFGDAITSLDAQSFMHFYFLGLVLLGNLALLAERRNK